MIKLSKDNETVSQSNTTTTAKLNKIEEDCNQKLQAQETNAESIRT